MKSINKFFSICLIIFLALLINRCETKERFYRPDVSQKLCTVAILDIDDEIVYDAVYHLPGYKDTMIYSRYISFEKSFQFEFPEEVNDSLRELYFGISDDKENLFVYHSNQTIRNLELILPNSLKFESGRKYFLNASDKETSDIAAEIVVQNLPPEPTLLSVKTEIITLDKPYPNTCYADTWLDALNTEIEFSFVNNNPNSYYAILLIGSITNGSPDDPWAPLFLQYGSGLLDFKVIETNTDGFFSTFLGREKCTCFGFDSLYARFATVRKYPISAYFIDGSKIIGRNCTLKISTEYSNGIAQPGYCKSFRVRLMAIPEELYLFEKSLYTYSKVLNDPFAEPVNLRGNIKGGNGIFAICRSRELVVFPDTTLIPVYNLR